MPKTHLIFLSEVGKLGNYRTALRTLLAAGWQGVNDETDQLVFRVSFWTRAHDVAERPTAEDELPRKAELPAPTASLGIPSMVLKD